MAKYERIRWTKRQQRTFQEAVDRYNANVEKLRKRFKRKHMDVELPNMIDADYEKRYIGTRKELYKFIDSLDRLGERKYQKVVDGQLSYGVEEVKRKKADINKKMKEFSEAVDESIERTMNQRDWQSAKARSRDSKGNKPLEGNYTTKDVNELRRQANVGSQWGSNYLKGLYEITGSYTKGGKKFYPEDIDKIKRIVERFQTSGRKWFAVIEFRNYYYLTLEYIYPNSADNDTWTKRAANALDLWEKLEKEFFDDGPLAEIY